MPRVAYLLEPITPLLFAKGGAYVMGLSGPSALATTRLTPPPSTISGMIASSIIASGLASPPSTARVDEREMERLLSNMHGEEYRLEAVLLEKNGRLYTPLGDEAYELERIVKLFSEKTRPPLDRLKDMCETRLTPRTRTRTGIALSYATLTPLQHALYTATYLEDLHVRIYIEIKARASPTLPSIVVLGGDRGIAKPIQAKPQLPVFLERIKQAISETRSSTLVLYLLHLTPAPLTPGDLLHLRRGGSSGTVVKRLRNRLAETLGVNVNIRLEPISPRDILGRVHWRLEAALLDQRIACRGVDTEVKTIFKKIQPRVSLIPLGYDTKANTPRPLYPVIDSGVTRLTVEASTPVNANKVVDIIWETGLAPSDSHVALGWGRVLPLL